MRVGTEMRATPVSKSREAIAMAPQQHEAITAGIEGELVDLTDLAEEVADEEPGAIASERGQRARPAPGKSPIDRVDLRR
jgi:hypothetical protein